MSSVASPGPLETRLPSVTIARPTRPSIGDVTCVNSRFSSAARSAASTAAALRRRLLRERRASIVLLFRDRVLGAKPLGALQLGVGALTRGARASELGAKTIDFGLERARIDLEERIASSDDGAFLEADRGNETGDARPDFDGIDGLQPAGEFVPLGHVALDDLATVTCGGGGGPCCAAVCEQPAARTMKASGASRRRHAEQQCESCHTLAVCLSRGSRTIGQWPQVASRLSIRSRPDVLRRKDYDFWTM